MHAELVGELKPVLLTLATNRQGVVFIWPVPLPDDSGRRNAWAETAREGAELAKTHWVRVAADMSLGALAPHRRGRRNCSVSRWACGRVRRAGGNC